MLNKRSAMSKVSTIVCILLYISVGMFNNCADIVAVATNTATHFELIYVRRVLLYSIIIIIIKSAGVGSSTSVLVCQGDRLVLTCSGIANSQQWTVYPDNSNTQNIVVAILSPSTVAPSELTVNHVLFHFFISSTSPLTSTVVIDNVTAEANGTRLVCTHSAGMYTSYTINVVTNGVVSLPSIMVAEKYGADNVTVILEWTKQHLVAYSIAINPDTLVQESSEDNRQRAQLMVVYNIMYSVKFVARLCGHNTTNDFELLYVTCDYLLDLHKSVNLMISGYSIPVFVGSNITISCLNEDFQIAYYTNVTITCMENGHWAPDPRQIIGDCNDAAMTEKYSSLTLFSNSTVFTGTSLSHNDGVIIAITTSAMTFVIITFIIGYLCGYFSQKCKHSSSDKSLTKTGTSKSLSTLPGVPMSDNMDLEMMENVAYGPLGSTKF